MHGPRQRQGGHRNYATHRRCAAAFERPPYSGQPSERTICSCLGVWTAERMAGIAVWAPGLDHAALVAGPVVCNTAAQRGEGIMRISNLTFRTLNHATDANARACKNPPSMRRGFARSAALVVILLVVGVSCSITQGVAGPSAPPDGYSGIVYLNRSSFLVQAISAFRPRCFLRPASTMRSRSKATA